MSKMFTRWRNKTKRKTEIEKLYLPNRIVTVFDTETTGLDEKAKIIQFSGIKYRIKDDYSLEKVDMLDIYINPNEPLSKKIVEITGITDEILSVAKDETYWADKIFEFLEDNHFLAGYNTAFDIRMLHQMANRTRCCFDELPWLDVLEMARDWVSKEDCEKHNLGTIVEYMHPNAYFQFHSSIEDVKATAMLMNDFVGLYMDYESDQEGKEYTHLEEAHLFVNPRKKSEQRIRLKLNTGKMGDIFWDIRNQEWGCCTTTDAKHYFNAINLENLEEQFLTKYGYKFGNNNPQDVARKWIAFKKEQANS